MSDDERDLGAEAEAEDEAASSGWTPKKVWAWGIIALIVGAIVVNSGDDEPPPPRAPLFYTVQYVVESERGIGTITYSTAGGDTAQDTTEEWRVWKSEEMRMTPGSFVYVSAQNKRTGTIRCVITINGRIVKDSSSVGEYSICSASGSV